MGSKIKLVFSVSTNQIGTKLVLIGGTIIQGTTAPGDNYTCQPIQVRFKSVKKQSWSSQLVELRKVTKLVLIWVVRPQYIINSVTCHIFWYISRVYISSENVKLNR